MLITANNVRVQRAEIVMPRIGAWHADLSLDATDALAVSGPVVITVGGTIVFRGTAFRANAYRERAAVRVVGGDGGLATAVTPVQQRGVTVRRILDRLLGEGGETLSPLSTTSVLNTPVAAWAPRAGALGEAIGYLLDTAAPGASWRVLDDGTVWVGTEAWLPSTEDLTPLDEQIVDGAQTFGPDLPILRPGTTLGGRRISAVSHRFEPDKVRALVWYEGEASPMDRLKAAFIGLANHALRRVDYYATYSAKVIRQQGDGRLEVRADDDRFRGLAAVAMRPGVHGITTTVRRGARVLFGFENGDPRKAVATGWESGTPESLTVEADEIKLGAGATKGVVRKDDLGDGGTFTAALAPATLLYTAPNGASWSITLTAGVTPVTAVVTPITGTAGKIITKAVDASTKVKAQ